MADPPSHHKLLTAIMLEADIPYIDAYERFVDGTQRAAGGSVLAVLEAIGLRGDLVAEDVRTLERRDAEKKGFKSGVSSAPHSGLKNARHASSSPGLSERPQARARYASGAGSRSLHFVANADRVQLGARLAILGLCTGSVG